MQDTIDVELDFTCVNAAPPSRIAGVNTFSFSASDTPVPDVFGVFVTPTDEIPLDPAVNRIAVQFSDATTRRGATSVAVQTLPEDLPAGLIGPLGGSGADGEYSQFSDSPFARLDFSGGFFFLEDFEQGQLQHPGASASPGSGFVTDLFGPTAHDSVDEDDGLIDGSGSEGETWFVTSAPNGVTWTFDDAELGGSLPTYAGLVWTDGEGSIAFEAFDADGNSMGVVTGDHANSTFGGEALDDRFYGAVNFGGISAIRITTSTRSMEIDHLQWGRR